MLPDHTELADLASVAEAIDALTWDDAPRPDRIGLEIEAFGGVTRGGRPVRLPLGGPDGLQAMTMAVFGAPGSDSNNGPLTTPSGGQITFEPGGQLEYSSSPRPDLTSLRSDVEAAWDAIQGLFSERPGSLVCLGLDPWHNADEVPQQLSAGRYVAMDQYFSSRWPAGAENDAEHLLYTGEHRVRRCLGAG